MNTKKIQLTILVLLMSFTSLLAQDKTAKFKVYGNCGMCESRIEKACKSIDGVKSADWDLKTKMIQVVFDSSKISLIGIHKAIIKVGHDTDKHRAKDEIYESLPDCCKFERKPKETK